MAEISRAQKIRSYILAHVEQNPSGIATETARKFKISRPGVHRHINQLIRTGQLSKAGTTRKTRYFLTTDRKKAWTFHVSPELNETTIWKDYLEANLRIFRLNVADICQFGFLQVVSNALIHAQAKSITIGYWFSGNQISLTIEDDGIGLFKKIAQSAGLRNERESILRLAKGRFSSWPDQHNGEGLFFCAKMFDECTISSNGISFHQFGTKDWYVDFLNTDSKKGTSVCLSLNIGTTRTLAETLEQYISMETGKVTRTHIHVKTAELTESAYVSRAQAQEILFDLEGFKHIVLDFKNVRTVGQSFVDEIFRVYQTKHPDTEIEFINENENVRFMIERSLS